MEEGVLTEIQMLMSAPPPTFPGTVLNRVLKNWGNPDPFAFHMAGGGLCYCGAFPLLDPGKEFLCYPVECRFCLQTIFS